MPAEDARNTILYISLVVCVAGGLGGLVNAVITNDLGLFPKTQLVAGSPIYRLGILGNVLIGAVTAFITWALYGELAQRTVFGDPNFGQLGTPAGLPLASAGGALLTGIGGTRVLAAEVDKRTLTAAASGAAMVEPDPQLAMNIANATSHARAAEAVRDALASQPEGMSS